jgi:hypothetical protein
LDVIGSMHAGYHNKLIGSTGIFSCSVLKITIKDRYLFYPHVRFDHTKRYGTLKRLSKSVTRLYYLPEWMPNVVNNTIFHFPKFNESTNNKISAWLNNFYRINNFDKVVKNVWHTFTTFLQKGLIFNNLSLNFLYVCEI